MSLFALIIILVSTLLSVISLFNCFKENKNYDKSISKTFDGNNTVYKLQKLNYINNGNNPLSMDIDESFIIFNKDKLLRSNHGDDPCIKKDNIDIFLYSNKKTVEKNGELV